MTHVRVWKLFAALAVAALVLPSPAVTSGGDSEGDPARGEDEDTIVFFDPPRTLEPEVTFLSEVPRIDGRLDANLEHLPVRGFSRLDKSDPANPAVHGHYRLAYGTHFFYAYVEAEGDRLTFRDRAYQNGDGFAMVLCLPTPDDEPTEEFYVLACSAVENQDLEWTRHVFWYYNVDTIFLPTSEETKLEFTAGGGRISFELYLPWKDVHPYHPWISEGIGFNLMFTKAIGANEKNRYRVIPGTVGGEALPRWYAHLSFQEPEVDDRPQTFVSTSRGNIFEGDPVMAIAVTAASRSVIEEIDAGMEQREGEESRAACAEYECGHGITRHELQVSPGDLSQGDYVFSWEAGKAMSRGTGEITVLPRFDREVLYAQLAQAGKGLPPGSYTTLEFKIQRFGGLLEELPPYEIASYERAVFQRVRGQLDQALRGEDPYAGITVPLRRAFRSKLDGTLQPYVVRVPEDYDTASTYPLLVFLHGSASTETDILGFPFLSPGGMIEIGPFGRGRSNGFATREAQIDVAEAIDDAIANYPVDRSCVILTGFSMGGYGVYRTFYETPEKFRAIAVFSGSPDLGRAYAPDSDPPDFLNTALLTVFEDVPVFIYHGEQDRNVRFDKTLEVIEKLRSAGARLEFHSDADRGHQAPSDTVIEEYHRWIHSVTEP